MLVMELESLMIRFPVLCFLVMYHALVEEATATVSAWCWGQEEIEDWLKS